MATALLATFGVTAKELFEYNRDYYTFDQKQRLDREMLRLEMQIKRFELFRDDIRDLVELTTSKMEMYHMVGALMMEFCVLIYTEGAEIAWIAEAPPFAKAAFAMALASAFVYILLAVWLSMHASVSAHSFGVRLLTRFVRLPIPGARQVQALNARLTDFEKQGGGEMLRVPFIGSAQQWKQIRPNDPASQAERSGGDGDERFKTAVKLDGELRTQDLLGTGEVGINDHDLTDAAMHLPGHHVQLFRRLQAKWQCYDTYARVCMSLGAYHLLTGISYYLLIATMRHYHSLSTGYALISVFMFAMIVLGLLDIGRKLAGTIILLQLFGAVPVFLAAATLSSTVLIEAKLEEEDLYPYPMSPAIFFIVALWHEGLLFLAWPSNDGMSLPRRFRTVLFIDVFSVADEALKQTSLHGLHEPKKIHDHETGCTYSEEQVMAAEEALFTAEAALRRWQAVPPGTNEAQAQAKQLTRLKKQLVLGRKMLNGEAARLAGQIGDHEAIALLDVDTRGWNELTPEEQQECPFAGSLVGPFTHRGDSTVYYYDLEAREFIWRAEEGREVLTLSELDEMVQEADRQVRGVLGGQDDMDTGIDMQDRVSMMGDHITYSAEHHAKKDTARNDTKNSAYVPQRLPWKAVCWMTRVLEAAWTFVGIMFTIEQVLHIRFDKYTEAEERRLTSTPSLARWQFEELNSSMAGGAMLRPSALACLRPWGSGLDDVGEGEDSRLELLLASPSSMLELSVGRRDSQSLWLHHSSDAQLPDGLPSGAALMCASEGSRRCMVAEPAAQGIRLWELRSHVSDPPRRPTMLTIQGPPWRQIAGAIVPCAKVQNLLPGGAVEDDVTMETASSVASSSSSASSSPSCLIIVGFDGRHVPVAAARLPDGSDGALADSVLSPVFDVPLDLVGGAGAADSSSIASGDSSAVVALHVEASRGRLWAAVAGNELRAWELLGDDPQELGRWKTSTTGVDKAGGGGAAGVAHSERVTALCEDGATQQIIAAVHSPTRGSTRLLRSSLL